MEYRYLIVNNPHTMDAEINIIFASISICDHTIVGYDYHAHIPAWDEIYISRHA
jgi:hypothetical protein